MSWPGANEALIAGVSLWILYQFLELLRFGQDPKMRQLLALPLLLSALAVSLAYFSWLERVLYLDCLNKTLYTLIWVLNLLVLLYIVFLVLNKKDCRKILILNTLRLLLAFMFSSGLVSSFGITAATINAFFQLGK